MNTSRLVPRFLDDGSGRVFVMLRRPPDGGGCVLVVPPFAEEMNKSRKMITDFSNELAKHGMGTLLVDLFGTGDSAGDFEQADWNRWKSDLRQAVSWAQSQGCHVNGLLAIRLGCALATEVAREAVLDIGCTVFWQPVLDGSRMLDQFLRLRVAAAMMQQDRKETTAGLRQRFAAGESIEVAGYVLSATLAAQLDEVRLQRHLGAHLGRLHWVEVVRSADAPPPAPVTKLLAAVQNLETDISLHTVPGEPFWSSVEIVVNAALVRQSAAFFPGAAPKTRSIAC